MEPPESAIKRDRRIARERMLAELVHTPLPSQEHYNDLSTCTSRKPLPLNEHHINNDVDNRATQSTAPPPPMSRSLTPLHALPLAERLSILDNSTPSSSHTRTSRRNTFDLPFHNVAQFERESTPQQQQQQRNLHHRHHQQHSNLYQHNVQSQNRDRNHRIDRSVDATLQRSHLPSEQDHYWHNYANGGGDDYNYSNNNDTDDETRMIFYDAANEPQERRRLRNERANGVDDWSINGSAMVANASTRSRSVRSSTMRPSAATLVTAGLRHIDANQRRTSAAPLIDTPTFRQLESRSQTSSLSSSLPPPPPAPSLPVLSSERAAPTPTLTIRKPAPLYCAQHS
jgi:hypothetical protein